MDPITITTSIFGLLKATETIAGYLGPYVSAARDTSQIVRQVHSEVVYTRTTLLALEGLIKNISSVPVRRAALIQVDQLVAVFTDGVLLFSELEASLPSPPSAESSTSRLPILSRLKWARKESTFTSLFTRLQGFKGSISLMLTILQSDSDSRAAENQKQLSENVAALLESNRSLYLRLLNLEDALEVRTIRAIDDGNASSMKQQPDESIAGPTFDFENDLETSRVYRKAQRESMDFSFRSSIARTNAWSVFSGLSLSDVSNISVIALPLYREDIENAQHYGCTSPPAEPITTPTTARGPKSLCEECLELELRLSRIPGIPEYFEKVTDDHLEEDPLTRLILVLRQGLPLLMILEKFQGFEHCTEVGSDYNDPLKLPKAATYKFISTCVHQDGLRLAPDKCFSVSELFGHDSTGFMKVVRVVDWVLDLLDLQNDAERIDLTTHLPEQKHALGYPSRDAIIEDFLVSERIYVAKMEQLGQFKEKFDQDSRFSQTHHFLRIIFSWSLPIVLDAQRQLLLQMEMTARKPWEEQRWGKPFEIWSRISSFYTSFIVAEKRAKESIRTILVKQEWSRNEGLRLVFTTSLQLLSLPHQCLPKFLAFLLEIERQGDLSATQLNDISLGMTALQSVLREVDAAIKAEELLEAQENLVARV